MMNENDRLIRIKEMTELTGLSKSAIYELCRGDKPFPKAIKYSPRVTFWSLNEVNKWIEGVKNGTLSEFNP